MLTTAWKQAVLVLAGITSTYAASSKPDPLHPRALSHPEAISTRIIPRAHRDSHVLQTRDVRDPNAPPTWDDKWLLSFTTHGEPLTLSLRPTTNLVHPDGIKSVHSHLDENGVRITTESILKREDFLLYEGVVLDDDTVDLDEWVKGEQAGLQRDLSQRDWAKIVVVPNTDAGEDVRFQGSYTRRGETFTIHSTPRYLATKDALDPEPPVLHKRGSLVQPAMVVVRERDVLSTEERISEMRKRGIAVPEVSAVAAAACGHDDLNFNTDPMHPVFQHALETTPWSDSFFGMPSSPRFAPEERSFDAMDLSHRFIKRQTTGGDIASGGDTNASSNFINSIGSRSGCPRSQQVLFMGVAADCSYTQNNGDAAAARLQILTDFSSASALYQTSFNIALGIVELNVQSGDCPTSSATVDAANNWNLPCEESGLSIAVNLNERLSVFSQWRGDKGGADGAGLWHLMTNCSSGSEVGVAWLGTLCRVNAFSSGGQTTSGTGVTASPRNEWQVIAHEIGHNFGAIHDCAQGCSLDGNCCPLSTTTCNAQADYIMSPVSVQTVQTFSPCSIGNVCSAIGSSLNTTCLLEPGQAGNPRVISQNSCGNGIVEEGEDCDPGSSTDSCCDSQTCRFVSGAVCSPLNSLCCSDQCQLASAGTVCRPAVDAQCDEEETCNGTDAQCPADSYRDDGTGCGNGLSCASGVCTSRDLQCQNAGASLNLREACPTSATANSRACAITCRDPRSIRSCLVLEQSFRDGTSCGYGGRCQDGDCQSGSALDTAKSWYTDNLRISIPVTIVVGIIVLLILWALIRCCCCGGRKKSMKPKRGKANSAAYAAPAPMYGNNNAYPPPPQQYGNGGFYGPPPSHPNSHGNVLRHGGNNGYPQQNGQWVDPSAYNGGYNAGGYR